MPNIYCLQSLAFPNTFLRTNGKIVNCQYPRLSWERWQFVKSKEDLYLIESAQYPGNFIMATDSGQIQMTSVQSSATSFRFVIPDIENPIKTALLGSNGKYLSITEGMSKYVSTGGGKVEITGYLDKSILLITPVE